MELKFCGTAFWAEVKLGERMFLRFHLIGVFLVFLLQTYDFKTETSLVSTFILIETERIWFYVDLFASVLDD